MQPNQTDVFVVMIKDRHCDTIAEVWTDREAAIARAKAIAKEYCRDQNDYAEETIQGNEFYVGYSCESDSVRVVKTRVQSREREQPMNRKFWIAQFSMEQGSNASIVIFGHAPDPDELRRLAGGSNVQCNGVMEMEHIGGRYDMLPLDRRLLFYPGR